MKKKAEKKTRAQRREDKQIILRIYHNIYMSLRN